MMQASHDRWVRQGVAGAMVCGWAILLAVVMASIQRMPVSLAMLLTIITISAPVMASRRCPGLLRRWWMWPILLLLALDMAFTWQTVFVYDERKSPAARAKEAEARRKAAAAE